MAMEDRFITPEKYTQDYADTYCNGNVEVAKQHAVVKETCAQLRHEKKYEQCVSALNF